MDQIKDMKGIKNLRFECLCSPEQDEIIRQKEAESLVDSVFRSLLNDDAGGGLFGVFEEKKSEKVVTAESDKTDEKPVEKTPKSKRQ